MVRLRLVQLPSSTQLAEIMDPESLSRRRSYFVAVRISAAGALDLLFFLEGHRDVGIGAQSNLGSWPS